ncbi:MAG: hypothetical protein J5517_10930 [Eubacterium sp.]|nr:hypothetical protein [Eubacterium sp.]
MDNTMNTSKMEILKGAAVGFAVGVMWELMIITPIMSDWSLRSIIVAMTVSGLGCSVAGGIFAVAKKNRTDKSADKVEVSVLEG